MIPPYDSEEEIGERVRTFLIGEIRRILSDLDLRRGFLVELWSVSRDRGGFIDTVRHDYGELEFGDLLHFEPLVVASVDRFFREVAIFELYFTFTDDMPVTLADAFDEALVRLAACGQHALDGLGAGPEPDPWATGSAQAAP